MADSITAAEYFERVLPDRAAGQLAEAGPEVREQAPFSVTYEIEGAGGGTYGLRFADGALEVVPGGIDGSDMRTTVSQSDWAATGLSAWPEPALDYYLRRKVNVIKSLKGMLRLELEREGAAEYEQTTLFGGALEPEVTIRMTVPDYAAMVTGELNGQMAFMTGKLKFDGSLPLLMQLGTLNV